MKIVTLLPFIVLIGAMFLMTRSAKNKQRQAMQMRDAMQPGTGVRTIGGMYATVKEIREDTVLLEIADGVHALFAKNAVGAVLEPAEYERMVNGTPEDLEIDGAVVPDDASSLTEDDSTGTDEGKIDLGKTGSRDGDGGDAAADRTADAAQDAPQRDAAETETADAAAEDDVEPKDAKRDGESDAK